MVTYRLSPPSRSRVVARFSSPARPMRSSSSEVHVATALLSVSYSEPMRMRDLMARRSSMAA
jgi:hypothetical protein